MVNNLLLSINKINRPLNSSIPFEIFWRHVYVTNEEGTGKLCPPHEMFQQVNIFFILLSIIFKIKIKTTEGIT